MHIKVLFAMVLLVLPFSVSAQDAPPMPEIDGEIVVEGLNGPQGLLVDSEGNLWISENGLGGEEEIEFFNVNTYATETGTLGESARVIRVAPDGTQETIATLPSVAVGMDILGGGRFAEVDGTIYFTHGIWAEFLGDERTVDFFSSVMSIVDGELTEVTNTWDIENAENPDGYNLRETHPYGMATGPDGLLYIADAAGNSLLTVDPATGEMAVVTNFEALPGVFPNPVINNELLAQAVPTAVTFDGEGTTYVSYLSGAPFVPGSAKVVTVSADGEVADFALGLTMLTDLKFGPDGNFYATQFGIFGPQGPEPNSGAVIRIMPDGTSEVVVAGLPAVTAIAFDAEGGAYVAINGLNPPGIPVPGMVVYYADMLERDGMPMPEMAPPPGA